MCDLGSQPTTFTLSWVLCLSHAWCIGVVVEGGTRGDGQLTEYFLPGAWPGLAAAGPAKLLPDAQPSVLVPSAGQRTCSDKTSLPAFPGLLLPIPSICGLVNINKARLQSGGKLVPKGGPGNWGAPWGLEAQDENTTSQEFVLKLSPEVLLEA